MTAVYNVYLVRAQSPLAFEVERDDENKGGFRPSVSVCVD